MINSCHQIQASTSIYRKGDFMAYETILTEKKDGVLLITFNRPKARNAMSSLMMEEFSTELERWDNDPT